MSKKSRVMFWASLILLVTAGGTFAQDNRRSIENCQKEVRRLIEKDRGARLNLSFATSQVTQAGRLEDTITGTATASGESRESFSYTCTVNIRNNKVVTANFSGSSSGPINSDTALIEYNPHIGNVGWTSDWYKDGEEAGIIQNDRDLQAIRITVPGLPGSIRYQTNVANLGWMGWVKEGRKAGTVGQSLDMRAIRIELLDSRGWSVEYSVYADGTGWQNWVRDGEIAGTIGQNRPLRAIKIRVVRR